MSQKNQAIIKKFVKNSSKHILWVYGESGTGKTRLVNSLAKEFKNNNKKVRFGSAQKFVSILVKYLTQKRLPSLVSYCQNYDLLILDNIDLATSKKPKTQEAVKEIIFEVVGNKRTKIVLLGVEPPEKLCRLKFSEQNCCYISLNAPDFSFKIKLLKQWAKENRITIPKQTLIDIAGSSENLFQLKGWFNQFHITKSN